MSPVKLGKSSTFVYYYIEGKVFLQKFYASLFLHHRGQKVLDGPTAHQHGSSLERP
jgi:hypothetical protein